MKLTTCFFYVSDNDLLRTTSAVYTFVRHHKSRNHQHFKLARLLRVIALESWTVKINTKSTKSRPKKRRIFFVVFGNMTYELDLLNVDCPQCRRKCFAIQLTFTSILFWFWRKTPCLSYQKETFLLPHYLWLHLDRLGRWMVVRYQQNIVPLWNLHILRGNDCWVVYKI